jgi:hypothetical protein
MVKIFHYNKKIIIHPIEQIYNFPPPPRVLVVAAISSVGIIRGAIESEQYRNFCSVVTTLSLLQSNMMAHCLNLRNCLLARDFLDVSPEGKVHLVIYLLTFEALLECRLINLILFGKRWPEN